MPESASSKESECSPRESATLHRSSSEQYLKRKISDYAINLTYFPTASNILATNCAPINQKDVKTVFALSTSLYPRDICETKIIRIVNACTESMVGRFYSISPDANRYVYFLAHYSSHKRRQISGEVIDV